MVQNALKGKFKDGYMDINKALKTIVVTKAEWIRKNDQHTKHIMGVLKDCNIQAKDVKQVVKMSAVDAMIYDVGSALGFKRITKREYRKNILIELFRKQ